MNEFGNTYAISVLYIKDDMKMESLNSLPKETLATKSEQNIIQS